MPSDTLSPVHLDYLQRAAIVPPALPAVGGSGVSLAGRRLFRVEGIGVYDKSRTRHVGADDVRSASLLTGLYGQKVPLAFSVTGGPAGITVSAGTWTSEPAADQRIGDGRLQLLATGLSVPHLAVFLDPAPADGPDLPAAGLVIGTPAAAIPTPADGAMPLDRLIRAMTGARWTSLILAEPVDEAFVAELRQSALNEIRATQAAAQSTGSPSPLARQHTELLQTHIDGMTAGLAEGAWRVGVYLLGDPISYQRLATAWPAVFAGPAPAPQPIRVWPTRGAAAHAAAWSMPYQPGEPAPGSYRHPFAHQTLLTSTELAGYVHLPARETAGYRVQTVPDFDSVVPPRLGEATLDVGRVVELTRPTTTVYRLPVSALTRHMFVSGVTGAGKTTTVTGLLTQLTRRGIPFLVIEPAKREYRSLLGAIDGLGVFTAGDENVSPLRLNPFQVPAETSVGGHIDLVRSVFAAGFGMWTPLPQVLERCLHLIYADRGWDLATGRNRRIGDGAAPPAAFPTLADLAGAVDRVVPTLGYDHRVANDIRAALLTRVNALRQGGKGRMLDVRESTPIAHLLDGPAVLELEPVADDDDKAFLMGLLLTRIAEHRRNQGNTDQLRHVLVIEEAHRLLSATATRSAEEADPRGKAVETFGHLLAEVRAYGQGIVIADQVPSKLLPDVIKNTGTKITHTLVATDDRVAVGGATSMTEQQTRSLASLPRGRAAIFADTDDAPVLVQIDPGGPAIRPSDFQVAEHMSAWRLSRLGHGDLPGCDDGTEGCTDPIACGHARRLLEDRAVRRVFARLVLSAAEDPTAVGRLWPDLIAVLRARQPAGVPEPLLVRTRDAARNDVAHSAARGASRLDVPGRRPTGCRHPAPAGRRDERPGRR